MKKIIILIVMALTFAGFSEENNYEFYQIADNFVDISENNTALPFDAPSNGQVSEVIELGNTFTFYGIDYTQMVVSSDGWISFDTNAETNRTDVLLPNTDAPAALIAPYWETLSNRHYDYDLHAYVTDNVYTQITEDRVIVMWDSLSNTWSKGVRMEAILNFNDNSIEFHTKDFEDQDDNYWKIGTVGIQNADKTQGLTIFHKEQTGEPVTGVYPEAGLSYKLALPLSSPPVFEPETGGYVNSVTISLTSSNPDADIYYTLNGEEPTTASNIYTSPITISTTSELKAISAYDAYVSEIISQTYTILNEGTVFSGGDAYGVVPVSNSPYLINGNINIPTGETLTIEPGVEFIFTDDYVLNVQGTILANGSAVDSIIFRSLDNGTKWEGIHFIDVDSTNIASILDYCRINGAYAQGNSKSELDNGGGIFVRNYNKLTVSNCLIMNNHSSNIGGGLFCNFSNITITNNTFKSNTADVNGGGLHIRNSEAIVFGNIISSNYAPQGLGIYIYNNDGTQGPTLSNNTIENNIAIDDNIITYGAGIYLYHTNAKVENNIIRNNVSNYDGGGVYASGSNATLIGNNINNNHSHHHGAGLNLSDCSGITINGNTIENNSTDYEDGDYGSGGGIEIDGGEVNCFNNKILSNSSMEGGGVRIDGDSPHIFNNNLVANNYAKTRGGGMTIRATSLEFVNNTIANNSCSAYGDGIDFMNGVSMNIYNSIFYYNEAGTHVNIFIENNGSMPNFYNCNIQDGKEGFAGDWAMGWTYTGTYENNVDLFPMFTGESDNPYSLKPLSPNVNRALADISSFTIPTTDIAGNPRIFDGTVSTIDIGAYELQANQAVSEISGNVSGTLSSENSPYYVSSDLIVANEELLTIEPGVEIKFWGHNTFDIKGSINAIGTSDSRIKFTVVDTTGYSNLARHHGSWGHMTILDNDNDIKFEFCDFEYSKSFHYYDNVYPFHFGGLVAIANSRPSFKACNFTHGYSKFGGAVGVVASEGVVFENCKFSNNIANDGGRGGALYIQDSNADIVGSLFNSNQASYMGGSIYLSVI